MSGIGVILYRDDIDVTRPEDKVDRYEVGPLRARVTFPCPLWLGKLIANTFLRRMLRDA